MLEERVKILKTCRVLEGLSKKDEDEEDKEKGRRAGRDCGLTYLEMSDGEYVLFTPPSPPVSHAVTQSFEGRVGTDEADSVL